MAAKAGKASEASATRATSGASAGACADGILRVIDANANRLKEGLRVCEEVSRFILNDNRLTRGLKTVRHEAEGLLQGLIGGGCIQSRDSLGDTGRFIHTGSEFRRSGVTDIFCANIQRVKESIRVLEEFSKIRKGKSSRAATAARGFKDLRYRVYEIEKQAVMSLRGARERTSLRGARERTSLRGARGRRSNLTISGIR